MLYWAIVIYTRQKKKKKKKKRKTAIGFFHFNVVCFQKRIKIWKLESELIENVILLFLPFSNSY